jgi:hypothetical protein
MIYNINFIKFFEFKNRIWDIVGIMHKCILIEVGVPKIEVELEKIFDEKSEIFAKNQRSSC